MPWREFVVSEVNGQGEARMVRTARYKYIVLAKGENREQLFDIEKDPRELTNLITEPSLSNEVERHRHLLKQWRRETQDEMGKRPYFGARLEPKDGRVLIGAGQCPEGFKDYYDSIGTNKPVVYMTYMKLNAANISERFAKLKEELEKYPQTFLIPQIGLSMTGSRKPEEHYEHKVAAGEFDAQIDQFCEGLKSLSRPVFLRIGYEFNGHWNGYKPATYKAAFRHVTGTIRKAELENVATVWCLGSGAKNWDFISFYPGDDVVDWWGKN